MFICFLLASSSSSEHVSFVTAAVAVDAELSFNFDILNGDCIMVGFLFHPVIEITTPPLSWIRSVCYSVPVGSE